MAKGMNINSIAFLGGMSIAVLMALITIPYGLIIVGIAGLAVALLNISKKEQLTLMVAALVLSGVSGLAALMELIPMGSVLYLMLVNIAAFGFVIGFVVAVNVFVTRAKK